MRAAVKIKTHMSFKPKSVENFTSGRSRRDGIFFQNERHWRFDLQSSNILFSSAINVDMFCRTLQTFARSCSQQPDNKTDCNVVVVAAEYDKIMKKIIPQGNREKTEAKTYTTTAHMHIHFAAI